MSRKSGFIHSEDTKKKIGFANTKYGKIKVKCVVCGKESEVYHYRIEKTKTFVCKGKCRSEWMSQNLRGEKNNFWKGGKYKTVQGYVLSYCPKHPSANQDNYLPEHRLIVEAYIGRYLDRKEQVHHINEIKSDNRIENLMVFPSHSEHMKFHAKIRQFGLTNSIKRQIRDRWKGLNI